jgi:hypothetical protein
MSSRTVSQLRQCTPVPGSPAQEPGDLTVVFGNVPALDVDSVDSEVISHRHPTRHELGRHKFVRIPNIHHEV